METDRRKRLLQAVDELDLDVGSAARDRAVAAVTLAQLDTEEVRAGALALIAEGKMGRLLQAKVNAKDADRGIASAMIAGLRAGRRL